ESVTLTCNATDPDGDALTFNWEVEHGQITGSGNPVDWTAPDSQGTYTVICKVSDGISGEVSESLFIAVTEPVLPTDGLLAYYPFNGTARDESGNNKDGVLMGAATANEVLKIDDNASDRLWLPYGIVDGLTNFTVSAWLK
ncbi:MAG: hypothetical protein GWO08_22660, partial [Gammaproteobacteria bacterium]|nr:hypothetical protein [Gammaproteobacteria bacterium]NIT62105.1 hypothetical protein [Fodinibius sp.]NIW50532.1 hypothetical protein [Gammaproteobacteria bacterium]NIX59864.1 hypothetical protein [candidate division Zixibacteria bacterium]NIY30685.1 hypothetical protein [Fodinibius sp.]